MKPSTKRTISLLLSALFIVVAISIYSRALVPVYREVGAKRGEYLVKQQALNQQKSILENVNSILAKYQSIPKLNEVVSLAVPPTDEVATIFEQLTAISRDSSLVLSKVNINTIGAAVPSKNSASAKKQLLKPFGIAQIAVNLTGNYASLKQFVQSVERNVRVMDISSIKFQPASKATQDSYNFDLVIKAYYQSQ